MNFISGRVGEVVIVGLLGVVFFVSVAFGIRAGISGSQSRFTVANAQQVVKALGYFKNDQDRYPSPSEFADRNIMLKYFSVYPVPTIISGQCAQQYVYRTNTPQDFELVYCLTSAVGNSLAGYNTVDESMRDFVN